VVTIVFADLAGSTALEERMDPGSVGVVMQRYYQLVREVVEARRGRVVKFIGDAAMAVFGVTETGEGDALPALDAALGVRGGGRRGGTRSWCGDLLARGCEHGRSGGG
jgi:class 3 adenylate cyclase